MKFLTAIKSILIALLLLVSGVGESRAADVNRAPAHACQQERDGLRADYQGAHQPSVAVLSESIPPVRLAASRSHRLLPLLSEKQEKSRVRFSFTLLYILSTHQKFFCRTPQQGLQCWPDASRSYFVIALRRLLC